MKKKLLAAFALLLLANSDYSLAADRQITVVNYEIQGVKQWMPGTLIVEEGDQVTLNLINKATAVHGFHIAGLTEKVDVKKDGTKTVSFKADKAGIFPINCHLHPAHVGGQLVVMKK